MKSTITARDAANTRAVDAMSLGDAEQDRQLELLTAYAKRQAEASRQPEMLAELTSLDLNHSVPTLLRLLTSHRDQIGAAEFIGDDVSQSYRDALTLRADLLAACIEQAAELPATFNHTDPIGGDGIGWRKPLCGPAGMALYALFDAATATQLLSDDAAADRLDGDSEGFQVTLLRAYINALADTGYAATEVLTRALPGAIAAGTIQSLVALTDRSDQMATDANKTVNRQFRARLSGLLNLCDRLALNERNTLLHCAQDYQKNDRARRAEWLLRQQLLLRPDDAECRAMLARSLHQRGRHERAIRHYRQALETRPDDAELYRDTALALTLQLQFKQAIDALINAKRLGGNADQELERAHELDRRQHDAQHPEALPTLCLSDAERRAGRPHPAALALAVKQFRRYGVLFIDGAFDADRLQSCQRQFLHDYQHYFDAAEHDDALQIGDRRLQISVTLEGAFNHPQVYANPIIVALMKQLLSPSFVLGSTVCATSLPGSKDQHLHKDHRALYTNHPDDEPPTQPPFAVTAMVPLVALNETIGTTVVKKGSHLLSRRDSRQLPSQVPIVPIGSCFLMDLRLSHQGQRNRTDQVRPILNMVYQQPWFFDNGNFRRQPPLRVPAAEYQRIPKQCRRLFDWATQPGPEVGGV